MYTARFAAQQNKPLYAIENSSAGNMALLQNGACRISDDFSDWDALDNTLISQ